MPNRCKYTLWIIAWLCLATPCFAQYTPPGWFIVEEPMPATTKPTDKTTDKEQAPKTASPTKRPSPQNTLVGSKIKQSEPRFAENNQDLRLTADIFKQLALQAPKNTVFSPLAFYTVSLMLANGIIDENLLEFSKLLPILRLQKINQTAANYLSQKTNNMILQTSLWGNAFSKNYRLNIGKLFGTEVWSLQGSTDIINNWSAEKTAGEFNDIIPVKPVGEEELYALGIANFHIELPFSPQHTKAKFFQNADGSTGEVMMMYGQLKVDYYEDSLMQAVRIPYDKNESLTIFLPHEGADLQKFIAAIDTYRLNPKFKSQIATDLFIPRISATSIADSTKELYTLFGITKIFQPNHNFAKMIDYDTTAKLEKIIYLTKINIIEKTDTPQAQTGGNTLNVKQFVANRPFIFMINRGDCIGYFNTGNPLPKEISQHQQRRQTEKVTIKEMKNGNPAWYENKSEDGNFGLKQELRNKQLR